MTDDTPPIYAGKTALEIAQELERAQLGYVRHVDEDGNQQKRCTVTAGHRNVGLAELGPQKRWLGICHIFGYQVCEAGTRNTVGRKLREYRVALWRERALLSRKRPEPGDVIKAYDALVRSLHEANVDIEIGMADIERSCLDDRRALAQDAEELLPFLGGGKGAQELLDRWGAGLWNPAAEAQHSMHNLLRTDPRLAEAYALGTIMGNSPDGYREWCRLLGARLAEIARA